MAPWNPLKFLSTLSLRRATDYGAESEDNKSYFYPRSPCGERLAPQFPQKSSSKISIHALLAESDHVHTPLQSTYNISIHALLAESDSFSGYLLVMQSNFYPRSPCGERLHARFFYYDFFRFLSTLSLRRATVRGGEDAAAMVFLSTLSLRRATSSTARTALPMIEFLSTLSLRRATQETQGPGT